MDNALLSFFQQDKDLITDNRPLRLRLAHTTQMLEDVLLPQRVDGSEAICGSVEYRILCVSLDAYIPLKELIALPVAVDVVTDRGDLRSICGIVTEARAGDSDGGLASYQLVLRDALSIMEKRINTRVFRDKNEVEIVQVILDEWMQTNPIIGACFRYEIDVVLARANFPQREFTMQYNESDAAFIRRLLKRRGVAWFFRAEQDKFPSHTIVLFNHTVNLKPNAADIVRYHRDAATEERDTITSWCAVRTLQPGRVTRYSWDYKQPWNEEFMTASAQSAMDQGENGNEMSASLDDYQVLAPHAGDDYDDFCLLGQLAMNRHDMDSKCFQGEGSVRDMCVGEYFTLEGHPEIDGHARSECEFVVTSMRLAIFNNLSKELAGRVERLFASNRWTQGSDQFLFDAGKFSTRVRVSFNAVRRGTPIVPAYDARAETPVTPMQSAFVVGPEGEEVHCDELGRVKIRFRTTRTSDHKHAQGVGASDSDVDSAWVRVASNWAGSGPGTVNQCGSILLPRIGTEVLVSFIGGDPERPVIVGQLYNQRGMPPALGAAGALPRNRYVSGIRSHEIDGNRGNQLRFDDATGKISSQLASDHGQSQLNLGYLTGGRVDGDASGRGEGAELRSDHAVAIRGESGVLITSEHSDSSSGNMLDVGRLTSLIDGLVKLAKDLGERATESAGESVTGAHIERAVQELAEFTHKPIPLVAVSGMAGIISATEAAFAVGAGKDIDLVSGAAATISAAENLSLRAVRDVSLYANEGSLRVTASEGKMSVQAQNDQMELLAKKVVEIISNSDWITIKAKKGVRINGGGTELELSPGGIKGYTSGKHHIHASDHQTFPGQNKQIQFPGDKAPHKVCVPCLVIAAQAHAPFAPTK